MKKMLALIMMVVMMATLATGCGNSAGTPDGNNSGGGVSVSAPEDTSKPETDGSDGDVIVCDPMTLSVGSGMGSSEVGSMMMDYLAEKIDEYSGGAITVNSYTGGTLYAVPEEFEAISNGVVDVGSFLPDFALSSCPYIYFPDRSDVSHQDAADIFNYITQENETTAALIETQMAEANVKILGCEPGGNVTFVSTKPITSFDEARNTKFGNWSSADFYEALGFTIIATDQSSLYDSLTRGVFETTTMGFAPMMTAKLYEAASNVLLVNSYGVANYISVNLDTWNSMTTEQQAVLEAAVADTVAYSIQYFEDADDTNQQILDDEGCTLTVAGQEDIHLFSETEIYARCVSCREYAANQGCSEGMETILSELGEHLGMDLSEEAVAAHIG